VSRSRSLPSWQREKKQQASHGTERHSPHDFER